MIRIGTRGSALALWQANRVAADLAHAHPGLATEMVVIKTTGDLRQETPLPEMAGKGVFVREIEAALLRGEIDAAVHSAKDLQSSDPDGLALAAFCPRADPRDALVAPRLSSLHDLPPGATVATGSPRRVALLRQMRPDLRFVEIRGNIDTRLSKLDRGDADALILAVAGLERLGRGEVITDRLPVETFVPQVGQGCVAVQCRAADTQTIATVAAACDHAATRAAVTSERAFLALLGGGCTAPVAAHARFIAEGLLEMRVFVADPAGGAAFTHTAQTPAGSGWDGAKAFARSVYGALLDKGASRIL